MTKAQKSNPPRRQRKPIRRQSVPVGTAYDSWLCPVSPEHGQMLDYENATKAFCPHEDHHRKCERSIWTLDEVRELRERHGTAATT